MTEDQRQHDTAQLKTNWVEKKNELHEIHRSIQDIDYRLQSCGLAIWTALGLSPNDVKDEEELYILPNSKLSKNDLQHKKNLLQYKRDQLEAEMRSLQATAKQIQNNAVAESDRIQDEYIKKEQVQSLDLYLQNPNLFFADVLFDPQIEWAQQKDQVYRSANKIMAVCHLFSPETDPGHLWQAWKIVARARDIETKEDQNSKRYAYGADKFFRQISSLLPIEMQGLKVLYDSKDYDRVEHYLSEVYVTHVMEDDDSYADLLEDLVDELDVATKKKSNISLSNNQQFNKLPKETKDQLISQHAYMTQSRFYLSLVDDSVWENYVKILDANINSVINKTISASDCENEFRSIRQKIAQNVQAKVQLAKLDMEEDFLRLNSKLLADQKEN